MIQGEDIIYVANYWFGENKTSAHHIAEILAENNRVLYVEASGQRAPRASKRDVAKIFKILRKTFRKPFPVSENLHLYSPVILPLHRFRVVRWLNGWLVKTSVRRAARMLGFDRPIVWVFMPHYATLSRDIRSKGVVYYITDEYSSNPNNHRESIQKLERFILERANVVFAVSDQLVERKRDLTAHCYLSLHGVDLEHFRRALASKTPAPADIRAIQHPIAGFIGFIEEWIDIELLEFLAKRLPRVEFVLVGKAIQDVSRLRPLANVHLLGHKPFAQLPDYLRQMDVCLLPYRLNTQVINSNPKKLREYLAQGKPVVSVRVREVERYGNLVSIADDYEAFAAAIEHALADDSDARREVRLRAMDEESWHKRVDDVSRLVARHIEGVNNVPLGREVHSAP